MCVCPTLRVSVCTARPPLSPPAHAPCVRRVRAAVLYRRDLLRARVLLPLLGGVGFRRRGLRRRRVVRVARRRRRVTISTH